MTGRYAYATPAGTLLFEITPADAGMSVTVLHMEMGMNLNPVCVVQEGNTLILTSVFFMAPKVQHTLKMTWQGGDEGA